MNPTKIAIIFFIIIIVFEGLIVFYTIPKQRELGGIPYPDPRLAWVNEDSWAKTEPRILTDMIAYMITTIISLSLFTLSWFAWRLHTGIRHETTKMFGFSMLFYGLGALSTTIGHAFFLMTQISYDPTRLIGLVFPLWFHYQ